MSELYDDGLHEFLEENLKPREEKFKLADIEEFRDANFLLAPAKYIYDYWEDKDWLTNKGIPIVTRDIWVACNVANSAYCTDFKRKYGMEKYREAVASLHKKVE